VDFRFLDLSRDELPAGDVAIIRQVLQHMSNAQIASVIPKLYRYRFIVLSEHISTDPGFLPNIEKPAGPTIRICSGSGVVLTAPPFNLKTKSERVLCSNPQAIRKYRGSVVTTVYEL
jgi:hypothetical protein